MKKYAFIMVLLVCFLISLPAASVNHGFTEAGNVDLFLENPEAFFIAQEEITIVEKGEVFGITHNSLSEEKSIFGFANSKAILLEFSNVGLLNNKYSECINLAGNLFNTGHRNSIEMCLLAGGADLFRCTKPVVPKDKNTMICNLIGTEIIIYS